MTFFSLRDGLTAESLMFLGGVTAFLLTLYLVRNRELREKYAVGWILAAVLLLLCGMFPEVLKTAAHLVRLSYPAAVLFIALTAIYLFAISVSISLTRQHRRTLRLMQEIALLEQSMRKIEGKLETTDSSAPAGETIDSGRL
jgi:hypothetical protein